MEPKSISPGIRWVGLVVFVVVCLGVGGLGAMATTPEIQGWYKTLAKPSWVPPDSVFGPVWTTLSGSSSRAIADTQAGCWIASDSKSPRSGTASVA